MSKGLEALKIIGNQKTKDTSFGITIETNCAKDYLIVEKELKALEIIKKLGIALIIPNNDFSDEHITIELYKKHFTKEQWDLLRKEMGLL